METKRCSLCKVEKPLDLFTKDKKTKDGRGSRCKFCYNEYKRENGYNAYACRPEYTAAYQRKLRQTEEAKKYGREYKKKYASTFSGAISNMLMRAKRRSKKNDLEMDLDRSWMTEHFSLMKCEATGVELSLVKNEDVFHTPFRPSIDRIDNKKGYTKDNCRIVAVIYNKAKSDYNDDDVIKMSKSLVTFLEKKA